MHLRLLNQNLCQTALSLDSHMHSFPRNESDWSALPSAQGRFGKHKASKPTSSASAEEHEPNVRTHAFRLGHGVNELLWPLM